VQSQISISDKVKEHDYCHVQGNEQTGEKGDGSGWLGHRVVGINERVSDPSHGESPNQNVTQSFVWLGQDVQVRDEQKRRNIFQVVHVGPEITRI